MYVRRFMIAYGEADENWSKRAVPVRERKDV